jgi:hypothetical protein
MAFAVMAFVLLLAGQAQAAELQATNMKVSVWPEYDDPRVLVIMQADLDPDTPLPAKVSFNVPKGAEIGMACEVQANGGHSCKPFQTKDNGDYLTLTFQIESQRKVFLEYYHQSYTAGTPERAFDFVFRPAFAATAFQLEVQQPARSTGFTLDPAFSQTSTDAEGLVYNQKDYTDVKAGENIAVKVAYTKNDNETSVKPKEKDGGGSGTAASSGDSSTTNNSLFVILGVLAFGTVIFGGYKIFRPATVGASSNRGSSSKRAPSRRAAAPTKQRARSAASGHKFCTSCGSRLAKQDLFCSDCGEPQV